MDIKALIGEATEYDKKRQLEVKKPKSWCKSISAFANSYGGTLIFGITDEDDVVGLLDAEGDAEKISEIIKTHLNPIPNFKLSFENVDDKKIVIVEVYTGSETPYYYEGDGNLTAFVRVGNESIPATPVQLRELVLKGSGRTYDSLKSSYDFDKMSFTKLKSVYYQRTGKTFYDTDYESFGLVDADGNLTNAGALLADESPVRHSRLFCTRWNGLTKASGLMDAMDDEEYSGGLVELLQDGIRFIKRNSKKPWKKLADRRIEYPEYPERAITEGLVNALIHRSYTELGSEVHIDIFDDRLEIFSPGGMMDGSTLQGKNLLNIPSVRRNPILADVFSRLIYMERRGSGFKKIIGDYQFQENYTEEMRPVFDAQRGYFTLILYNLNYIDHQDELQGQYVSRNDTNNVENDTNNIKNDTDNIENDTNNIENDTKGSIAKDIDKNIIQMMKENPKIATRELAELLGVSMSTIKRHIKAMPNVSYVGVRKKGHWEVRE